MPRRKRRISFGGQVVESSLRSVGFEPFTSGVSLIETADPRQRYDSLLLQNAWNVIPWSIFNKELQPYPKAMQIRALARRHVARWNLMRAKRVVCLTHAVGHQLEMSLGVPATVSPVSLPIRSCVEEGGTPITEKPFALVTGTVTWYKRPHDALRWLTTNAPSLNLVWFVGNDDGSGCWQSVANLAKTLGIRVSRMTADHAEMYRMYSNAEVTILPSAIESLGFSLGEALLYSQRVVASPIEPHVEVAARIGTVPEWTTGVASIRNCGAEVLSQERDSANAMVEWKNVALTLGLSRM